MVNDVWTVIWKEWKELIARSTQSKSDAIKTLAVAAVILTIIVSRASSASSNTGALIVPSFILVQLLAGIMADSFAGERERHTLETLLASRLSDLAILIGKILAGVLLAWGLMILILSLGLLGRIFRGASEAPGFSVLDIVPMLAIYLLICLAASCAAVIVSLRAPTVRQAIQTLTWSFMIVFFLGIFAASRIPPEWRLAVLRALAGENLLRTEFIVATILAALTAVLFGAARLRFQRAKLILD